MKIFDLKYRWIDFEVQLNHSYDFLSFLLLKWFHIFIPLLLITITQAVYNMINKLLYMLIWLDYIINKYPNINNVTLFSQ